MPPDDRLDHLIMLTDVTPPMAAPRVAAGALFRNEGGQTLLVKPTYKPAWDIPGGYVEPNESPREACEREISEELSLDQRVGSLLVVDWAPAANEGDKILFVFDGGQPGPSDIDRITLPADELAEFRFFPEVDLVRLLPPRLSRRITAALNARRTTRPPTSSTGPCVSSREPVRQAPTGRRYTAQPPSIGAAPVGGWRHTAQIDARR